MNLPNKLTLLRVLLTVVFLAVFMIDFPFHYLIAGCIFGLAAITDLLDGKIARRSGLVTNFGKFLDPIADKMLTTAAFLGFVAVGNMNIWALMLILTREFAVTSVRLLAASSGQVIAANLGGKFKTVLQFVSILWLIAALEFSTWSAGLLAGAGLPSAAFTVPVLIGEILIWLAAISTVLSGLQYIWANRSLFQDIK